MIARLAKTLCLSLALAMASSLALAAAPDAEPKPVTDADMEAAVKLVKEHLAKLNAQRVQVLPIKDDPVLKSQPGQAFVAVRFPQFPVGIEPPAPLKPSNLFAVKDGKIQVMSEAKQLEPVFRDALTVNKDEAAMKNVARAWLRLSQEFFQDGFYKFSIPEDSLTATAEGKGIKIAGKAVVDPQGGNKGEISVSVTFDADGKFKGLGFKGEVFPGIRPRCQATKLLDADPIIRAMAEQDIVVMGQMAKEYLDEQRTKASPELQKAMDRVWKRILDEGR